MFSFWTQEPDLDNASVGRAHFDSDKKSYTRVFDRYSGVFLFHRKWILMKQEMLRVDISAKQDSFYEK